MNVSDVVIRFLEKIGTRHVFLLSGGGIMYLLDALGKSEKVDYVCNYHEQACAIAADGYARMSGFGVCFATFGPGAVNALSGVVGAWYDSVPMLVVSGQVRSNLVADYDKVRQVGPQEGNVLEMVKPVTKYAVSLRDPSMIQYELEKAYHIAKNGRPGPVWIELPLDMQSAEVDLNTLPHWQPEAPGDDAWRTQLDEVVKSLESAARPVLILGNGVRLSGMYEQVRALVERLQIPVLTPYTGKDLLESDNTCAFGTFGTAGQRHANLIMQNADLILGLGVGFCVAKTGFETSKFAVGAKKVFVDIDPGQLQAHPLKADMPLLADLRAFVPALQEKLAGYEAHNAKWLELCRYWEDRYPLVTDTQRADCGFVNSYVFMEALSRLSAQNDIIVTGNGLDCVSFYQGYKIKAGQRAALNGNWGSMGWDLPTAVGAHYGTGQRVLCIAGDGGVMLNSQELLTIGANKLPIKVFIFNNDGYGSIKATQDNLFNSRYVGANPQSNVFNPDFEALAAAYRLGYSKVSEHSSLDEVLGKVLASDQPEVCEVMLSSEQWISPKASTFRNAEGKLESKPLDDMFPFLPDEETRHNRELARAIV